MTEAEPRFLCSCGGDLYIKRVRVQGWYATLHLADGSIDSCDESKFSYGAEPATVTCAECGKRHPNPHPIIKPLLK